MLGRKWNAVMRGSRVLSVGIVCAVIAAVYGRNGEFSVAAILGGLAVLALAIGGMMLWGALGRPSRD
jgi:hypothetical protein